MEKLMPQYTALEQKVIAKLTKAVNSSKYESKHISHQKAIRVLEMNLVDYTELTIVNDRLTFLNHNGYHFSIYNNCTLQELIEIADKL